MNKKIILAGLLTLASVAGVVGTVGNAHKTEAASARTIYLKLNNKWSEAEADLTGWVWGGSTKKDYWVTFTDSDGDGIYEASVYSDNTDIIFHRSKPGSSGWNEEWNRCQTTIPADKNQFTLSSSSENSGAWENYDPWVYYMEGDEIYFEPSSEWKTANAWFAAYIYGENGNQWLSLTDEDKNGTLETIIPNGSWKAIIFTRMDSAKTELSWDSVWGQTGNIFRRESYKTNNKFSIKGWDNGSHWVNYTPTATEINNKAKNLIKSYYNDGTYVRNTHIDLKYDVNNEESVKEMKKYFHAGSLLADRVTYFTPNALWMSREDNKYSYYGTQTGTNYLTNGTAETPLVDPTSVSVAATQTHTNWDDQTKPGMEGFYITLDDICTAGYNWTRNGKVYSSNDEAAIKDFLAFTAPCFLNYDSIKNVKTDKYFDITSVSVEETAEGLKLSLHIDATDSVGKLITTNSTVLSYAIITK